MINLKTLMKSALVGAVVAMAPLVASAVTVSGQIDISGRVNLYTSDFSATGNVDLDDPGIVLIATGDFAATVSDLVTAALTDIDFAAPGAIWSVGGFTFTAASFTNIVDGLTKSFKAIGSVSGNGFDVTAGTLQFTTQGGGGGATVSFSSTTVVPLPAAGFLLIGALGGLGVLSRRRKKAA